ncbi:MAG: M1 family metallopeptidase [Chloroflexi bacterium]|nr:M1 family metallopeptidase [Chloroflexota bacterium]
MKRLLPALLIIGMTTALIGGCKAAPANSTANDIAVDEGSSLDIYHQGLISAEQDDVERFQTATRYELTLSLAEPFAQIEGQEQVTYWNNEDVALNEIYLRMFPNNSGEVMVVNDLQLDGVESAFTVEYNNSALRVDLPTALQPGESITLKLDYTITVPTDFGGNYGLFSYIDGILALDQVYAIIPVYDDEGWNVEVPALNGDMIYSDPAFFTVTLVTSPDVVIATSGVKIDEQVKDEVMTQTIVAGPVRDFYMVASTRYAQMSEQVGETLVTSYYPEEYEEGGQFVLEVGVNALKAYNERFGTYPYTELDLVGTPMQAGGMEYSGIVAMGVQFYDPEVVYAGLPAFTMLEMATAHEVAHQWFFNMVMSDQIDEPWIDEGMAQYLTALYFEDTYGSSAARSIRESWYYRWNKVKSKAMAIGLPVRDYSETEYGAIIYGRAPLFIEALREKMGDTAFFDFMHALFAQYQWGILTTEEYRALAEQFCNCDLQQEFVAWVYPE